MEAAGEARPVRELSTVRTSHEKSSNNEDDTNKKSQKKSKKSIKKSVKTLITTNKKDSKAEVKQEIRNNLRNGVQINGHSPSVTFNDRPTGMIKDVRLFVDPHRNNYGRRASLCESLFGIVPGNFNSKPENHSTSTDNRIMVQALLPGNEAIKSGNIKIGNCNRFFYNKTRSSISIIKFATLLHCFCCQPPRIYAGDWLMCVNDVEINLDNMDNVLSTLTSPMHVSIAEMCVSLHVYMLLKLYSVYFNQIVGFYECRIVNILDTSFMVHMLLSPPHIFVL